MVALGLAAAGLLTGESRRVPLGMQILAEADSPYQSLRVVELDPVGPEGALRMLQVNEGLDSYQSVWKPEPGLLGPGYYYDYLALPLAWMRAEPCRTLVLGLGAGTCFRVLTGVAERVDRELELTGVELDPAVIELGRRYFDLDRAEAGGARVLAGDARVALRALRTGGERYDLVILDCYANQSELPPHLVTLEMFAEIAAVLAEGGVLAINVGAFGPDDPILTAVAATGLASFGAAQAVRVPATRNWVLFAGALPPEPGSPGSLGSLRTEDAFDGLLAPLSLPGAVLSIAADPSVEPLTDDHAPTDVLQRRSLQLGREFIAGSDG